MAGDDNTTDEREEREGEIVESVSAVLDSFGLPSSVARSAYKALSRIIAGGADIPLA